MISFGKRKFLSLLPAASFSAAILSLSSVLMFINVGHLLGESALAAVNVANPWIAFVGFLASLLSLGTSVVRGHALGRGDREAADRVFSTGVFAAAIIGLVLASVYLVFGNQLIDVLGAGAEISGKAKTIMRWYCPAVFTTPLMVVMLTAVMMDGGAKFGAFASALRLTVQFVLQIAFLRRYGVAVIVLSAFASDLAAIAVLSLHFRSKRNSLRLVSGFSFGFLRSIVTSSIGDAGMTLCSALVNVVLITFITRFYGDQQLCILACYTMALSLIEFMNGVGNALAPVISVYTGERNPGAIVSVARLAELISIGEGLLATVCFVTFPGIVIGLLGMDAEALSEGAITLIRLSTLGFACHALVCLYNTYYVCIQKPALSILVCYLEGLIMPAGLMLAFGWRSPAALWTAVGLAPFSAIAVFFAVLYLRLRRHPLPACGHFPLMIDDTRAAKIETVSLKIEPTAIVAVSKRIGELMRRYFVGEGTEAERMSTRAALLTEEVLMAVRDRNGGKTLNAEVTLDFNETPQLTIRDDGIVFDITDEDQRISSLRSYLVSSLMSAQSVRQHYLTTGFNRNLFRFDAGQA